MQLLGVYIQQMHSKWMKFTEKKDFNRNRSPSSILIYPQQRQKYNALGKGLNTITNLAPLEKPTET